MKIACIVLAAGRSQRFGDSDKLLTQIYGKPLIWHAADCAVRSCCTEVHVVIRPGGAELEAALAGLPVQIRSNPHHTDGIGSSIAYGVAGLTSGIDGTLVLPADMPWMETILLNALIERFETDGGRSIVCPTTTEGEQRNPVLWPRSEFHHLRRLSADQGARSLITSLPTQKIEVRHSNDRVFRDVDAPGDLPD